MVPAIDRIIEMSFSWCGLIATIEQLIFWSTNFCTSAGSGGCGSPSEMIIMCFADAVDSISPLNPARMAGSNDGMSLMSAALIFGTISSYSAAGAMSTIHSVVPPGRYAITPASS